MEIGWVRPVGAHTGPTELDKLIGPLRPSGNTQGAFLSEAPHEFQAQAKFAPMDQVMSSTGKPSVLKKPTVASVSLARFKESRENVTKHIMGGHAQRFSEEKGLHVDSTALKSDALKDWHGTGELIIDFKKGASYDGSVTNGLYDLGAKWTQSGPPKAISLHGDIPLSALGALDDMNVHSVFFRGSKDLFEQEAEKIAQAIPLGAHVVQFDLHSAVTKEHSGKMHSHVADILDEMAVKEKYPRAVVLHHALGAHLHKFYGIFGNGDVALVLHQPVGMTTGQYKEARQHVDLLDVREPVQLLANDDPSIAQYEPVTYDPTYWTNSKKAGIVREDALFNTPDQGLVNRKAFSSS